MNDPTALRRQFQDELEALTTRLKAIQRDIHAPKSADWQEQAVDSENDEVLDALDVATREKIEGLRSALEKLDEGSYGVCEDCGDGIKAARLEAIPWASLCLKCAD